MAINDGLGNRIFLTWSGSLKDLGKAIKTAKAMRATGTTFRGCSFDDKVSYRERCPVCGEFGLKPVDTPYDHETRAHTQSFGPRPVRAGTFTEFKKSQRKS
jgi:hypothetical protein